MWPFRLGDSAFIDLVYRQAHARCQPLQIAEAQ